MVKIVRTKPRATPRRTAPIPKGVKDPRFPGHILIPVDSARDDPRFRKVDERIIDNTYYRFDTKAMRITCLVTIIPDKIAEDGELHVAWDMCGRCHDHFRFCRCKSGIYHGASIAHIKARNEVEFGDYVEPGKYFDPFNNKNRVKETHTIPIITRSLSPMPTRTPDPSPGKRTVKRRTVLGGSKPSTKAEPMPTMADIDKAASKRAKELTEKIVPRRVVRRKKTK